MHNHNLFHEYKYSKVILFNKTAVLLVLNCILSLLNLNIAVISISLVLKFSVNDDFFWIAKNNRPVWKYMRVSRWCILSCCHAKHLLLVFQSELWICINSTLPGRWTLEHRWRRLEQNTPVPALKEHKRGFRVSNAAQMHKYPTSHQSNYTLQGFKPRPELWASAHKEPKPSAHFSRLIIKNASALAHYP